MALMTSESRHRFARLSPGEIVAWLNAWLADRGERRLAQRVAGAAFLIRVASAGFAFIAQVLFARWMGSFEFGIYVYVWTWLLMLGALADLGIASTAQRFIPEYTERGAFAELRGYLSGSRWLAFGIATLAAVAGATCVKLLDHWIDGATVVPLYLACLTLPIFAVMHAQDGIARSYNWVNVALLPPYIVRQIVVIASMGAAYFAGLPTDATTAIAIAGGSVWITGLGQTILLNNRLRREVAPGKKAYELRRWIVVSAPMFAVDTIYLLLMYVDVLILKQFRSPEEIAIYYAAARTLSLVAFVYFAVSVAAAHKFTAYFVAGDRARLAEFVADATRWTFWPSLAATVLILALGWPLLWLFGSHFVTGYNLMFILAIGLLARAALGPGERFLNMLGQQKACAVVAAGAFAVNLALCLLLVPRYGAQGAAIATSSAFVVESVLLFLTAKRRLGFHLFIWGRPA